MVTAENFIIMKKFSFILPVLFMLIPCMQAQNDHPHILVSDNEKSAVLKKIAEQEWAKAISARMIEEVTPYVERHASDPQWILSRYLMNWVPGKRYTRVFSDN